MHAHYFAQSEDLEYKRQQQIQHHISKAKSSSDKTQADVDKIVNEDYPTLKGEMEELVKERKELEEELEYERIQCSQLLIQCTDLNERKNQHLDIIKRLNASLQKKPDLIKVYSNRIKVYSDQIQSISDDIEEKNQVIHTLSTRLEDTDDKYKLTRQRMTELGKELSRKTIQLTEVALVLSTLQESLVQSDVSSSQQAQDKQMKDKTLLREAKRQSQSAYIAEIDVSTVNVC